MIITLSSQLLNDWFELPNDGSELPKDVCHRIYEKIMASHEQLIMRKSVEHLQSYRDMCLFCFLLVVAVDNGVQILSFEEIPSSSFPMRSI